ncbi:hypothetical protein FACS1894166_08230 [Bacilli bacterium]|nr:hypothetical protein FACS1894166_08230 [Bacilli bacterium]
MVTKLDEPAVKTIRKPRKQSNVKHLKAKKVMSKRTGKAKPKKHKR